MLRFLLATIIVMSVVFIYSSYPLKKNLTLKLHIVDSQLNLQTTDHPVFRQVTKIHKEEIRIPMKELNNTGEFSLGDDENENITIAGNRIYGFPNLLQDVDDIDSISGKL